MSEPPAPAMRIVSAEIICPHCAAKNRGAAELANEQPAETRGMCRKCGRMYRAIVTAGGIAKVVDRLEL